MASFTAAGRLSLRLAGRRCMQSRAFNTTSRAAVAQNFTMPALSPTMTEGSIQTWHVKEGDRYSAGDVLLEIETDKATMDVEAQEDGVVFKILQADGSKGVQVGKRIAVLAEAEDDVATLEMPPDEPTAAEKTAAAAPAPVAADPTPSTSTTTASSSSSVSAKATKVPARWPLYPSVSYLIKQNGLDPKAVVGDMTPTGPGGRLLKGDVLAYLGKVSANYPTELESRLDKLSHLDLSNIKIKETPKAAPVVEAKAAKEVAEPVKEANASVTLSVSLAAVIDAQDKIQSSLGVFMPVSTFVSRATEVANDALPRAGPAPAPSVAALFDSILSSKASSSVPSSLSRGFYHPQISALPSAASGAAKKTKKTVDIIDILSGKAKAATPARAAAQRQPPAVSTGINFFSLSVPKSEEKRAKVFLERLKVVLENETGRLVL
ncbi:pyruvate dehydrogenase protein x component [Ophiostoma piceae UAMH 11346]|uniref:Pyruvate dehydrogenase protein x component n=1 Tax=Ophiostoma piceae (strain UAMH 11346) TaxID=1262450 RepID=S3D9T7_OPHP1|nr:pyruvate dehydrogenase protein x component [Ophiostoma piceae UAMH 11346]